MLGMFFFKTVERFYLLTSICIGLTALYVEDTLKFERVGVLQSFFERANNDLVMMYFLIFSFFFFCTEFILIYVFKCKLTKLNTVLEIYFLRF